MDLDYGSLALHSARDRDRGSHGVGSLLRWADGGRRLFTPFGDYELAGTYFVEVAGTSGAGSLKLAVDGNVTTLAAVPEPSTWAMFGIGFAGLAAVGLRRRRGDRESARYAL
jgi:PEP-CTERM motif